VVVPTVHGTYDDDEKIHLLSPKHRSRCPEAALPTTT